MIVMNHHALAYLRAACCDERTARHNFSRRLVAGDHRCSLTARRTICVQIASAHPRGPHFYDDVFGTGGRIGKLGQHKFFVSQKHHSAHADILAA